MKAQDFLKRHLDHITIRKLLRNEQLTPQDLSELERILAEDVGATDHDLDEARAAGGLGHLRAISDRAGARRSQGRLRQLSFRSQPERQSDQVCKSHHRALDRAWRDGSPTPLLEPVYRF